jgi:hypothetical protein
MMLHRGLLFGILVIHRLPDESCKTGALILGWNEIARINLPNHLSSRPEFGLLYRKDTGLRGLKSEDEKRECAGKGQHSLGYFLK